MNLAGGYYDSALASAAYRSREDSVRVHLVNKAVVSLACGTYGNTLASAACHGFEAIVRLLLENGADVNLAGGTNDNALNNNCVIMGLRGNCATDPREWITPPL